MIFFLYYFIGFPVRRWFFGIDEYDNFDGAILLLYHGTPCIVRTNRFVELRTLYNNNIRTIKIIHNITITIHEEVL